MKILVPIKRVVDYNVKVRPLSYNTDVDLNADINSDSYVDVLDIVLVVNIILGR